MGLLSNTTDAIGGISFLLSYVWRWNSNVCRKRSLIRGRTLRTELSRTNGNPALRAPRLVPCTVAFLGYSTRPDLAGVLVEVHLLGCMAERKKKKLLFKIEQPNVLMQKMDFKRCLKCYLVSCKDTETVYDLFSGVCVGGFASHKIEEGVKLNVSRIVRVDNREDTLEIDISLSVLSDWIS